MLFGKKEVLKNNHWAGKGWGNMQFVKKHWNQLAEAPTGQTKDNLEIKIMTAMDLTTE